MMIGSHSLAATVIVDEQKRIASNQQQAGEEPKEGRSMARDATQEACQR